MQPSKKSLEMVQRLFIGSIAIALVILCIGFSQAGWFRPILGIALATIALGALWEYYRLAKAKGIPIHTSLCLAGALIYLFIHYLQVQAAFSFKVQELAMPLFFGWLFLIFFGAYSNKRYQAMVSIPVSVFGILYVVVPLGLVLDLLYLPTEVGVDGRWWLSYVVVVTALTNMGGYFIGRRWGKRPLAPLISPKKTIEGAIASLVCALIGAAIWSLLAPLELSFIEFVFLAIIVSIVAQMGDLAESLLKRDAQVKDSGHLPGLGGILDEVDSYLFTLPLVYVYLKAFYGLGL